MKRYGKAVRITVDVHGFGVHSLRATAATNALVHNADIAKLQEWLGHANVSTTRIYDKRTCTLTTTRSPRDTRGLPFQPFPGYTKEK